MSAPTWYRLPADREPLEFELLRALARPAHSEAAKRLLYELGTGLPWPVGVGMMVSYPMLRRLVEDGPP